MYPYLLFSWVAVIVNYDALGFSSKVGKVTEKWKDKFSLNSSLSSDKCTIYSLL